MDTYFFDEYEQNDINELEKKFTDCVEQLMDIVRARKTIKYRNWKIIVYINYFMFRGHLPNNVTIYRFHAANGNPSFLHVDRFCFKYYPNNILLRAICYAFEIKSAAEFEKFISVLTAAAVSMV